MKGCSSRSVTDTPTTDGDSLCIVMFPDLILSELKLRIIHVLWI